jgi:hypothetical protein
MQGTGFVLVRSVASNPDDREAFNRPYATDHYPLIFSKVANLTQAPRFWSRSDPAVHYAPGEFSNIGELQRATSSEGFKHVIADYDRVWGARGVSRTPDLIEKVHHFGRE